MKKIIFLAVLFAAAPFLLPPAASGFTVQTNGKDVEVTTNPPPAPTPQVIVVRPAERTTVVQPSGSSGCSLQQY